MIKQDGSSARGRPAPRDVIRGLGLLGVIGIIATLHYVTDPSRVALHELYNYLCFIPIIFGAHWFGAAGGVAAAALTSAVFIPHLRAAWAINAAYTTTQYGQVLAFHLVGLTVGLLVTAQRRLTARYRDAATSLEQANRDLRDSKEHLRRADRLSAFA